MIFFNIQMFVLAISTVLQIRHQIYRAKAQNPNTDTTEILARWGVLGEERCYSRLGITLDSEGNTDGIPADEPVVVYSNHCFTTAMFGLNLDIFRRFKGQPFILVLKQAHWSVRWFFQKPLERAGMIILKRNGDGGDIAAIRARAEQEMAAGRAPIFWILWTAHRPKRKRVVAVRKYLRKLGISWADTVKYAQVGFPGGLGALIAAFGDRATYFQLWSTFNRWPKGKGDFLPHQLRGATLHLKWQKVDTPPSDREALKKHGIDFCYAVNGWVGSKVEEDNA